MGLWSFQRLNCFYIYQLKVVSIWPVLENVHESDRDGEDAHEEVRDGKVSDEDVLSCEQHLRFIVNSDNSFDIQSSNKVA